jgi:hypothetical protein
MSPRSLVRVLVLVAIVASCSSSPPSALPAPSAPSPSSGSTLPLAELKIRLVEQLGPLWFCDPDIYPVARADEADLAKQRFGDVQADRDAFTAITTHTGLGTGPFTDEQKLWIYRYWKMLNAVVLDPAEVAGIYRFDYLNRPAQAAGQGRRNVGTIDADGVVTIEQQAAAGQPPCPICLARGTRIATPDGEVAIEHIRVGMQVWSIDEAGRQFVATVVLVGRRPVPASHHVVRLILDDGRVVRASPGHPLADGRLLGTLGAGDRVDGATVVSATLEPYAGGFTFDLLPYGPTGTYFADGIPLGSTLGGG